MTYPDSVPHRPGLSGRTITLETLTADAPGIAPGQSYDIYPGDVVIARRTDGLIDYRGSTAGIPPEHVEQIAREAAAELGRTYVPAEVHDTHSIPVHDAEDGDLCANESCGACATPAADESAPTAEDLGDVGHRAVKRALAKALGIDGDMSWAGLIGSVTSLRAGRDGYRDSAIYSAERAERRTAELVAYRRSVRDTERATASPTTDIHDHPAYGVIDDAFGNSSNVVEFHAGPVAVGRCGAVDDDGCIRLAAAGHGPVEYGAASIHLDTETARQLLGELGAAAAPAKTHDLSVRKAEHHTRISVEDEEDEYLLHIPADQAELLGRMLSFLTPAQVAILAAELTGESL